MMQLAIGDALAIALLEARGFTPSDFKTFHPGGSLGASLIHIRDHASRQPFAARENGHAHAGCDEGAGAEEFRLRRCDR